MGNSRAGYRRGVRRHHATRMSLHSWHSSQFVQRPEASSSGMVLHVQWEAGWIISVYTEAGRQVCTLREATSGRHTLIHKRRHVDQPKLTHVQNIPTTVTTCISLNETHHTKNDSILTTDDAYRSLQSFDLVLSAHLISLKRYICKIDIFLPTIPNQLISPLKCFLQQNISR